MTQWRPEFNPESLYFVAATAIQHAHIFQRDVMKRLLIDHLDSLRSRKQIALYAFVIMPNHLHIIIRCLPPESLADVVRNYKSVVADRIIRQYQVESNHESLQFLASQVVQSDKQQYQV